MADRGLTESPLRPPCPAPARAVIRPSTFVSVARLWTPLRPCFQRRESTLQKRARQRETDDERLPLLPSASSTTAAPRKNCPSDKLRWLAELRRLQPASAWAPL